MAPLNEPIAIVGSACRFPGASSTPSKLWSLLSQPRDVLTKIPPTRFDPDGFYNEDGEYHGSTNVQESYLLAEDHRLFDASFFKIKPVEAHCMDPQQRLLMETVYESLEAGGLAIERLQGSDTAVYVGLMCEEYSAVVAGEIDQLPTYTATATARSIMSNRVSYFFDWHGPCMTIDTACSSSLIATHQAVETLRNGTSKVAIAAGSNLLLGPTGYITESKLHMLSPGSRSRMWDAEADGYARGDGVACLVLKKLSDAIRDGDHIECLIRETGVNQDGRTTGITMPSSTAQEALIRSTYAKAGLDITNPQDRCQFFEAHGTGTPAGDPIEAAAIHNAFFGADNTEAKSDDTLYVGSVKTVIGHTEGTAGIAAVMKASLAIQNGTIPPNMLFNQLSPAVEPFYKNLEIVTSARPWPAIPEGAARRASVNSFGFGGTNAHAILEQYIPAQWTQPALMPPPSAGASQVFLPFCLSAASEKSLVEQTRRLASWLEETPDVSLPDLAWTLSTRRSTFAHRWYFSAGSVQQLRAKIQEKLEAGYEAITPLAVARPKILGVFTGQGAQWAGMGRSLILGSQFVRTTIDKLEASLASLPDPPAWSLKAEMLADKAQSRISEAALSQPLCTAVQVVLVDMLRVLGVRFEAVVGHSSGEIGAAYAAGFLRAEDAIRIAYYRGVHSKLARGPNGQKGAMLAAGTSLEDAREFCDFDELRGRISVAASNSSASVTLSGDADAIEEANTILVDEGKFSRMLRVDTAYHSHHMAPCAGPYTESLRRCTVRPLIPDTKSGRPAWFSSVNEQEVTPENTAGLDGVYWRDNMVQPVLFSQAVQKAVETSGPFDLALEVGPHPALQGPALQTIQDATGARIPYTGTLRRGADDTEAFADAIGYVWRHLADSSSVVDVEALQRALSGGPKPVLLKGLPSYAFEHDRVYWRESRMVKTVRTRKTPYHQLLGVLCPDGSGPTLLRWKNLLSAKELPWLSGHMVQGQIVFPAAGYMSMAIDACRSLAASRGRRVGSLDILDFSIGKAVMLDERGPGVETLLTLALEHEVDDDTVSFAGTVRMYAGVASADVSSLPSRCVCRVRGTLEEDGEDVSGGESLLPSRTPPLANTVDVDADQFYTHLADVGYEYSDDFRALTELRRTLDAGTAIISSPARSDPLRSPTLHPATLDCAIQAVLLGFCSPGDGKLYALHVPTRIRRVAIDVPRLERETRNAARLPVDSVVSSTGIVSGDAHLFAADGRTAVLQMQGIEVVPLSQPTPATDAQLFFAYELGVARPDGELMMRGRRATPGDYEFAVVAERIAYYYLRRLLAELTPAEIDAAEWHHKRLVGFARNALANLRAGPDARWYHDTREEIYDLMHRFSHRIEITLARAVGENLPAAVRGETVILEHMVAGGTLDDFYAKGLGFNENSHFLAEAVVQIAHRFPHMHILEIGAGTGGATKIIVPRLGTAFSSYTFTDISGGFFPTAQEVFSDHADHMVFRVLDAEKDVLDQGFREQSYDLVVASLVLHATRNLEDTMRNVRRLLKPGGYVAMLELTNVAPIRTSFAMSGLPGWWLGDAADGREFTPCVDARRWDSVLRATGFSPVDAATPDLDPEPWPFNVLVAQALDDRVVSLRKPLSAPSPSVSAHDLVVLGGTTLATAQLAADVSALVAAWFPNVRLVPTLEDLLDVDLPAGSTVLSLTDLDSPIFRDMTDDRLDSLKRLCEQARNLLWLTRDSRDGDPYLNMSIGFGRTVAVEMPQLRLQFLDFSRGSKLRPNTVAEALLRLQILESWDQSQQADELLWSIEPEIILENDRMLIPRLRPVRDRNERYNSTRRDVVKPLAPSDATAPLDLSKGAGGYAVRQQPLAPPYRSEDDKAASGSESVRLVQSLVRPLKPSGGIGSVYVSIGRKGDVPVLVFSQSLTSTVIAPSQHILFLDDAPSDQNTSAGFLAALAGEILAERITTMLDALAGTKLIVHEIPAPFTEAITRRAHEKGIKLVTSTVSADHKVGDSSINPAVLAIHPRTSPRSLAALLPRDASLFIDFSSPPRSPHALPDDHIGSMIARELSCPAITADHFFGTGESDGPTVSPAGLDQVAALAAEALTRRSVATEKYADLIAVADLVSPAADVSPRLGTVVSWTQDTPIPVKVENIDSGFVLRPDRTYILFGLSGQLGKSLCTWMVQHGARYVVLTSRRPEPDADWIRRLEALGAVDIRFAPNDITDRAAVEALLADTRATMPPIAGIANGAMVLHDIPVRDLSLAVLDRVLGPKVRGSRYLDELLGGDDLDFAVFFTSLASVFGSHGQSNYTAANMYMNSLAARRRRSGLPASVIAIGAITGIGYMARELTQKDFIRIKDSGYSPLSERDFHQLFCEAVLSSSTSSPSPFSVRLDCEVICGVKIAQPGDKRPITWMTNPMIGHCVIKRETARKDDGTGATLPVKTSLLAVTTKEAAFAVMRESFSKRLQGMLQSESAVALHMAADELGVDSLVAVDIRSWFLKEVGVDLPVLKILGGASVGQMLEFALDNMSPTLMPNVDPKSVFVLADVSDAPVPAAAPATAAPDTTRAPAADTAPVATTSAASSEGATDANDKFSSSSSSGDLQNSADFTPATDSSTESSTPSGSKSPPVEEQQKQKEEQQVEQQSGLVKTELMSFGQSQFWFLQNSLAHKTAFNIATMITLRGRLRVESLRRAVDEVARHHEALRTRFYIDEDGNPVQAVLATPKLALQHREVADLDADTDADAAKAEAEREYKRVQQHVYDLESGDTMQISLVSDAAGATHHLIIGYHHINMDGVSLAVLMADIHRAYRGSRLSPVPQYPEFSSAQRAAVESGAMADELAFWRAEFDAEAPLLPLLPFSAATSRRPLSRYDAYEAEFTVSPTVAAQIRAVARTSRVSPFHIYLATFRALLTRLTAVDDIVIGMGDANRSEGDVQGSVGMFLNLLPLRFRSENGEKQTFDAAIREAQSKVRKALAHSRLPFSALLDELRPPRRADASPLFQAFIDYRQPTPDRSRLLDCKVAGERYVRGDTGYDVVIDILDTYDADALVQFTVPKLLYSENDVRLLAATFADLLDAYTKTPSVGITEVPLFSDAQVKRAIQLSRGPTLTPSYTSLPHRIRDVVAAYSSNIALRDGRGDDLTYGTFGSKIASVARALTSAGVAAGSVVPVLQEPTTDWAITVLALLSLGAAYAPLDARLPPKRLAAILGESAATVVVAHSTTRDLADSVVGEKTKVVRVDEVTSSGADTLADIPLPPDSPHRPAMVLYTSGSTGTPKGVVLRQSSILAQVEATIAAYGVGPGSTVLQQTAFSFDIAAWQLLMGVLSGAALYVVPQAARGDPVAVTRLVATEGITLSVTTPSEYANWLRYGDRDLLRRSSWAIAVAAGEKLTPAVQSAFCGFAKPGLRLFNAYGPCEATFVATNGAIDYNLKSPEVPASIGAPLPGYATYILGPDLEPLPPGAAGQIALGGVGIAAGYLGRPELTAQSFVPNPYASDSDVANGNTTIYLTGDGGILRDDGSLILTSRLSGGTQVKIRGSRFDLEDVETNLVQSSAGVLSEAVASVRGDPEDPESQFLVAHVVFSAPDNDVNGRDDRDALLQRLIDDLPLSSVMKPILLIPVDKMPLSINLKVDRAAVQELPLPEKAGSLQQQQQQANAGGEKGDPSETIATIRDLWFGILPERILALRDVDADTDFFSVGGNSLLLARLQSAITSKFGVSLPLVHLFESSTLGGMASLVAGGKGKALARIEWAKEIELPSLPSAGEDVRNTTTSTPRNVVLTGATGFLGRAILDRLVASPAVERIDCVAVRDLSTRELPPILRSSNKIHVYGGDLGEPNLGLSPADAVAIFGRADAVVHNAADVSFLKSYHSLRRSNVEGTRALLGLVAPRRIPVHFVSTAGVAHLKSGAAAVGEVSLSGSLPPADGSDGYVASKWASEQLLERAHRNVGLPVWIHRPSSVMGEGAAETDLMTNLLRYSLQLQAVPIFQGGGAPESADSFLDFVDVETAARSIVESVVEEDAATANDIRYKYQAGEYVMPLGATAGSAGGADGDQQAQGLVEGFKVLSLETWIERAQGAGMNELVVELLRSAVSSVGEGGVGRFVMFPRLIKGSNA